MVEGNEEEGVQGRARAQGRYQSASHGQLSWAIPGDVIWGEGLVQRLVWHVQAYERH